MSNKEENEPNSLNVNSKGNENKERNKTRNGTIRLTHTEFWMYLELLLRVKLRIGGENSLNYIILTGARIRIQLLKNSMPRKFDEINKAWEEIRKARGWN